MARALLASGASGAAAASGFLPPWFVALCMVVASVWVVSFTVFLCGRSSVADDDLPKKKKPAVATTTKARPASVAPTKARSARSGTVVDTTGMYGAAYGGAVVGGGGCACCGGGGGGGGGCGGGGC